MLKWKKKGERSSYYTSSDIITTAEGQGSASPDFLYGALIKGRRIDIDDRTVDYTVINDYTCDIDSKREIRKIERRIPDE